MAWIDSAAFVRGLLPSVELSGGSRLPAAFLAKLTSDTVAAARISAGVHLAFTGDARVIEVVVELGARTTVPAPTVPEAFIVRVGGAVAEVPLPETSGVLRIDLPARGADELVRIYFPESVEVRIGGIQPLDGTITPADAGPRFVVYGDSISQGWSVTQQGAAWPSLVAEELGLDLVNLGFAGSARGELLLADVIAASQPDVVALAWGTNAWSSLPTDDREVAERMRLFLTAIRQNAPSVPIVVVSPICRPDAETAVNRFGTTHERLRTALEEAVRRFIDSNADERILLVPGRDIVPVDQLVDGLHPGDAGQASLARAVTPHVAAAMTQLRSSTHVA